MKNIKLYHELKELVKFAQSARYVLVFRKHLHSRPYIVICRGEVIALYKNNKLFRTSNEDIVVDTPLLFTIISFLFLFSFFLFFSQKRITSKRIFVKRLTFFFPFITRNSSSFLGKKRTRNKYPSLLIIFFLL